MTWLEEHIVVAATYGGKGGFIILRKKMMFPHLQLLLD